MSVWKQGIGSLVVAAGFVVIFTLPAIAKQEKPKEKNIVQQAVEKVEKSKSDFSFNLDLSAVGDYLAADYASRVKNHEIAAALYANALAKDPDNPVLLQDTYKLMLLSGEIESAFIMAKRYLEYDPTSVSAKMLLAYQAIAAGDYQQSRGILQGMMDHDAYQMASVDMLVLPFIHMWQLVQVREYGEVFQRLHEIESRAKGNDRFILSQKALIYDMMGLAHEADDIYNEIAFSKPYPRNLVAMAANFFERQGVHHKALFLYNRYHRSHHQLRHFERNWLDAYRGKKPERLVQTPLDGIIEVLMEAVRVLYKNRFYEEALAYNNIVLYLSPNNAEALMIKANALQVRGYFHRANEVFRKVKSSSILFIEAQANIAQNYFQLRQYSRARTMYERLAHKHPRNIAPYLMLADLLRMSHQFSEASLMYSKAIKRSEYWGFTDWSLYFARGICYERSGNWKRAQADLMRALRIEPAQADVLNYLGYSWIERGINMGEAKTMIEQALNLRPEDPHIMDSMGWALFREGKAEEAKDFLEAAVLKEPFDAVLNDHLGDIYWFLGRKIEARFQWQRALDYNEGGFPVDRAAIAKKLEKGL